MTPSEKQILSSDFLEKTIIGICLHNPAALEEAFLQLTAEDFQEQVNRTAWTAICEMRRKNDVIDFASAVEPFMSAGMPIGYLTEIQGLYLDTIDSQFARQQKFNQLISLSDRVYGTRKANEIILQAKAGNISDGAQMALRFKDLADELSTRHAFASSGYVGDTLREDINSLAVNNKSAIKFGIGDIDKFLGGMLPGQYIIVAARPATGKSALVIQPFIELARNGGIGCILTLEMTRAECMQRIVANIANVSTLKVSGRETPTDKDCTAIVEAMLEIKKWQLSVIDTPSMKINDVEKLLAQARARGKPIRMIAIDHFGLLVPEKGGKGRYDEYTPISNKIKQLAKQYECTFIVLAQLNRIDDFQKPTKMNLRDTGSLEQDSDKIIFLYRDKNDEQLIHVNVDKNRQGGEGETELIFMKNNMRFFGKYPTY